MRPTTCAPRLSLRVVAKDGRPARLPRITEDEGLRLIRAGYAHTFGTRRRIHGLLLTVDTATAAAELFADQAGSGLRTVFRETVGGGFHVWTHRAACGPRSLAA